MYNFGFHGYDSQTGSFNYKIGELDLSDIILDQRGDECPIAEGEGMGPPLS